MEVRLWDIEIQRLGIMRGCEVRLRAYRELARTWRANFWWYAGSAESMVL